MNTRMVVLLAVLAACFLVALAISRAVVVQGVKPPDASSPSRISQAEVEDGFDVKTVSNGSSYMRTER